MKSILVVLFLFLTNIFAYEVSLDPDVLNQEDDESAYTDQEEHKLYFQLGISGTYIVMTDKLKDSVKTPGTDDNTGVGIDVAIGYKGEYITTSMFMQRFGLSNIHIMNMGFGASYYLSDRLYVGALAGESFLTWDKSPVKDTTKEVNQQSSPFLGFELGMDYNMKNDFSLYTKYQFLYLGQSTDINDDKSIIQHDIQNNIGFGLKYGF